ncbi:ABC transporter ATP-binding protein [Nocardioides sp.]|uniref:ABC transporter ATP-binding protein n=1 Tax=Nocardioides sp. TaxID=35761 RepID=UPI002619E6D6|nr:ABC transporter ATP-binding protein [Nocardioides sp.]
MSPATTAPTAAPVVAVRALSRAYADVVALDDVDLDLHEETIYGLLGRNGAGKTTLMRLLTGQDFATTGTVEVFGGHPLENDRILGQVAFISEGQSYPPDFCVAHVLKAAALLYPNWDESFADSLLEELAVPRGRRVKKLSRGQRSAVGVVVGLASRAPLTLFDEPYVGLDAVARQIFYDRLLADYAEHPRTFVLSTHLIDEVGDLIERVVLLDGGRVLIDEDAEALRGLATTVTGPLDDVDTFAAARQCSHVERLGNVQRVTVHGALEAGDRRWAEELGLTLEPVSLQQYVVRATTQATTQGSSEPEDSDRRGAPEPRVIPEGTR